MSGEFDWGGYPSQALSGVSEALQAAGVDCTVPERNDHDVDADIGARRTALNTCVLSEHEPSARVSPARVAASRAGGARAQCR